VEKIGSANEAAVRKVFRALGLSLGGFVGLGTLGLSAENKSIAHDLEPFYVTAYRVADDVKNYPGNVTVLDEALIQNSGLSNLAELLQTYAGIHFKSFSGNSSSSEMDLRGYGEGSGLRTLILVDGQKLNRPDLAVPTWLEIPIGQIERVEVLRGAQTARYGDQAIGGVLNIVTKLGLDPGENANRVEAVVGSYDTHAVRLNHRGAVFDWNYSISLEDNRTGGYRENGGHAVTGGIVNFGRAFGDVFSTRVGISFFDERVEFPGGLGTTGYRVNPRQSIYTQANQAQFQFGESEHFSINGTAEIVLNENSSATVKSGFSQRDQASNLGSGAHFDNLIRSFSFEPKVTWQQPLDEIAVGIRVHSDRLDHNQYAQIDRTNRIDNAKLERASLALYAYAEQKLFDESTVSGALRWEHNYLSFDAEGEISREKSSHGYAAQLGLNTDFLESWRSWLRYDLLYRFPVMDETAAYQGYPLAMPFNEDLEAEKGHNIEAGLQFTKNAWDLKVNAFAQWLDGEVAYNFENNLNVNLADTSRLGVELSSRLDFDAFELQFFYTWIQAEYQAGKYAGKAVYLVPQHKLSGLVALTPTPAFRVQMEYQYTSDAFEGNDFENNREPLPGHQVINLMARYQLIDNVSIFFRLNNVFDEKFASLKYAGLWYPAPGRHVNVGCTIAF